MGASVSGLLRRTSITARVFAAPLLILGISLALLWLGDRQADASLGTLDTMHLAAAGRSGAMGELNEVLFLVHSDVSRHLSLSGSGLEDAKLAVMRTAVSSGLTKAEGTLRALAAGAGAEEEAPLAAVGSKLKDYAKAALEMNEMAAIDRLIAIPLMAHVDEEFAALKGRLAEAEAALERSLAARSEATRAEAAAARQAFWFWAAGILSLFLLASKLVVGSITRPLGALTAAMGAISAGRLDTAVEGRSFRDEVGAMARALEVFRGNALQIEELRAQQTAQAVAAEAEKRRALHGLSDLFDAQVEQVVRHVAEGAADLRVNAASMLDRATESSGQAESVAVASSQAGSNVQSAAAATEELAASIDDISKRVRLSFEAVRSVDSTDREAAGLSEAASRIGDVVRLISDIASQTNLLARNATIQAARAGEAGKGFAVVASEVKTLAGQTAKATEEIGAQIFAMQQATGSAVASIRGVGTSVLSIDEMVSGIAASLEQQSGATREIARSVQEAAQGTNQVVETISGVSRSAADTGTAARRLLDRAEHLRAQADALDTEVKRFIGQLRAA